LLLTTCESNHHDNPQKIRYEYGFDEVSGNFQFNNYGRGGLDGDYLIAEVQDGRWPDNACFLPYADGSNCKILMSLWGYASPERDSSLNNEVIIHEYGHGVSTRLTGGPSDVEALYGKQSGGMGEGWSDFWALALTAENSDTANLPRTLGGYVMENSEGIRKQPYTYITNMTVNPYSYGSVASMYFVHEIGEVWCSTLWDVYWDLVDEYNFSTNFYGGSNGNHIAMQLVMDGLKLQPAHPTMLDARDAILYADLINNDGENLDLLWNAFARRGMGIYGYDGGSHLSLDVLESFDVPDDFIVYSHTPIFFQGDTNGPFTSASHEFELMTTGSNSVSWSVENTNTWFEIYPESGIVNSGQISNVSVTLNSDTTNFDYGTYFGSVVFSNLNNGTRIAKKV